MTDPMTQITVRYAPLTESPGRPVRFDYGSIAHEYVTLEDAIDIQNRSLISNRCKGATGLYPDWKEQRVSEAYSQLAAVLNGIAGQRHTVPVDPGFSVQKDSDGGFTVVKEPWEPKPGDRVTDEDFNLFPKVWVADENGTHLEAIQDTPYAHPVHHAPRHPACRCVVSDPDEHRHPGEIRDLAMDLRAPFPDTFVGECIEAAGPDPVHAPSHYTDGGIETIDYLRAKLSREAFVGFCQGNALKYLSRAGKKGSAAEDFAKAAVYCRWAEEAVEGDR